MKKTLLPLAMIILVSGEHLKAQTDTLAFPVTTITSNRIATDLKSIARSTETLDCKNINALSGTNPNAWLGTMNGVDMRQRGAEGVQADIGIRGGSFDQTLVLLNGMKISDPQTGHLMMNLPVTNEAIQQMDVLKTSASRTYGINALAGSVNLITKVPEQNVVYGGAYYGDFGLYGLNAGAAFRNGRTGNHISFSHSSSSGYKPNTDFSMNQVFYQNTTKTKDGELNLRGGYTNKDYGASGFYAPNSTEYERTKTAFGGLSYQKTMGNISLHAQGYYRYNEDDYVYKRENPSYYHNHHYTHTAGAELHFTFKSRLGVTGFGADARTERIRSNNLGNHQRNILGIFAEHRFSLINERLGITPGIYMNVYSGNNTAVFPGIDASFKLTPKFILFASADKGMRLPTYTDLYYKGPANIGNPDLKAETAINTELGLKYFAGRIQFNAAVFNRSSDNLIDWARYDPSQKWQPLNLNHVDYKGFEAGFGFSFRKIIDQVKFGYTYINADYHQPADYSSRYTLSNIRNQFIGTLYFHWVAGLYQSATFRYVDRVSMADYYLFDSKVYYQFSRFKVYTDVSNITNISYQEAGYVTMPGRWYKVGFEFRLTDSRK